ncbi:hypothetical protein ACFL1M_00420 [Patescibacteria group bacterium]
MKVYFTASARGKASFEENYRKIYDSIEELGHENADNLVFKVDEDSFYSGNHKDQVGLFKKAMKYISSADVVVLEVSVHSFSMGYVLHKAIDANKPVVAMYLPNHEPHFALGIDNDRLQVVEYKPGNVKKALERSFEFAQEQMDTRFNFFISPKISHYLDWISKKKRVPRAVYLRRLIEQAMKREQGYEDD